MKLVYPKINLEKVEERTTKTIRTLILEIIWYTLIPVMLTILSYTLDIPSLMLLIIPSIILRVIEG